jgi:23S rRNA U2552 (ribose-2'-O)-methylase RlmE/FtsJ
MLVYSKYINIRHLYYIPTCYYIMIHFQLPRNTPDLYSFLTCKLTTTAQESPDISGSLSYYLGDIKQRIQLHADNWDIYKRYTNPYEYIHTCVPNKKKSVAKRKPLSRSYFKMVELTSFFRLLDVRSITSSKSGIRSFHLAEGPGGFIEALSHMRENKLDTYTGMSILDDVNDTNVPAWKKSQQFLRENRNVHIENGADGTGNILKLDNFEYCKNKYGRSMHIVTGDGGFDFSSDFNNQEHHIIKLLFGQIVYALVMQCEGGCFILKMFDCFTHPTIDMLALLSSCYEKVYITKPQTSRYANSEKYLVCKGFLNIPLEKMYPLLHGAFSQLLLSDSRQRIERFFNIPMSLLFTMKIEEYNAIFGQQQIENIHYTLFLIESYHKNDKVEGLIKKNVQKCVLWCEKYNVSFHNIANTNVFLEEEAF